MRTWKVGKYREQKAVSEEFDNGMYAPLVVNVANRPEWSGSISIAVFPRPLTTAMMYDLKRGRTVLFAEAWAAQGFAHSQLPCIPEKMKDAFRQPESWMLAAPEAVKSKPIRMTAQQFKLQYQLEATMVADQGSYAIVDGQLLRIGEVIETNRATPVVVNL